LKLFRHSVRHFRKRLLLLSAAALVVLSFATSWYFDSLLSVGHQQKLLQRYLTAQQKDAEQLLSDQALLRRLVLRQHTQDDFNRLVAKEYGFFLFAEAIEGKEEALFWNSQKILPPPVNFINRQEVYFRFLGNGYYVIEKRKVELAGMTNNIVAYVLIPVFYKYSIESDISPAHFAHDRSAINKIAIAEFKTDFPVFSLNHTVLFHLRKAPFDVLNRTDALTVVLRLTALMFLLIGLHLYARKVLQQKGAFYGIAFFAGVLLVVRIVLYFYPQIFAFRQFTLFDPSIYGSGKINRSLGDLLISSVFICWIVLFVWHYLGPVKKLPRLLDGKGKLAGGVAGVFLLLFITLRFADLVHKLVTDSKISFEVTDFSKLDIYTAFSFLILTLLTLSYYYFSRLLFRAILQLFPNLLYVYFTVAIAGLIFLSFQHYREVLFGLPVLLWLVIYSLFLTNEQSIFNRFRITIAGILFWIFIFSVSLAALIMQGNSERERLVRQSIAAKYEEAREPTRITAIAIGLGSFDGNYLKQNFHRFQNEWEHFRIKDSILNAAFHGYSSAYNTGIYIFDAQEKGVNNTGGRSYAELNNIFTMQGRSTGRKDLVMYEKKPEQVSYLIKREAYDSTSLIGTLFLVITPKRFDEKEPFYTDIFRRRPEAETSRSTAYAIYQNNQLVSYTGTHPFPLTLNKEQIPVGMVSHYDRGNYDELWYKGSNQKIIIIARKKESTIESITLFSYLFSAFLFVVALIRLFTFLGRVAKTWPRIDVFSRLNIRSQIHVTIIFITLLSFLVIGVATITYFVQRYKRNNIESLSRTSASTLSEFQKKLDEDSLQFNAGTFTNPAAVQSLTKVVTDIADVHGVIVNLYDTTGTLQVTSHDQIYNEGVLSSRMDPAAFHHLYKLKEVQKVQEESISNIQYQSIYTVIRNPKTGEKIAYLNIPASATQKDLNQEISNFIVTIINLNAFIVLIAGVIALFITNRITRSFSVIGDKMKEITLGRTNEEIAWTKDDEIGELVKQYNKMVRQLEESASALAKSEREGAWREMARQVAHEIKNPLTPMKLSIQYLQKAIQNNQPNVKDLTTSVASTLIEQIDHLSKIAADFSQFANIGNKRVEQIDLHHVISSLLDLYSTNPKVEVTWNPVLVEANMRADKTHMNRLFTNLLTNAVDACSEREKCLVVISEKLVGNDLLISITDNGDGIPKEIQSKIFTPNFTTKTSGTGLGLAMCKGIVEQAGGHIWFQTKEGEGTTFFVQLPLVQ
jgi:two-component system, NtrC family, nitrogen regulation sensor histidine kinase NtrY